MAKTSNVIKTEVNYNFNTNFDIEIVLGKSIRIKSDNHDITFKVGDTCEESSYNLTYFGTIVNITEKSVVVKPRYSSKNTRMKINRFAFRNYNFDLQKLTEENHVTSLYI